MEHIAPLLPGMIRENVAVEDAAGVERILLGELPPDTDTLIISAHSAMIGVPWHRLPIPGADRGEVLGDRREAGQRMDIAEELVHTVGR